MLYATEINENDEEKMVNTLSPSTSFDIHACLKCGNASSLLLLVNYLGKTWRNAPCVLCKFLCIASVLAIQHLNIRLVMLILCARLVTSLKYSSNWSNLSFVILSLEILLVISCDFMPSMSMLSYSLFYLKRPYDPFVNLSIEEWVLLHIKILCVT